MGMLHSPYECQGTSAKTLHQMKPLQSLPTYIDVKGGGFICLYYDFPESEWPWLEVVLVER